MKQHTTDTTARYVLGLELDMLAIDLDPYYDATITFSEEQADELFGHLPHYWRDKALCRAFHLVSRYFNNTYQST